MLDRWRGKFSEATSSATMQQIDEFDGGVELVLSTVTNPDAFYLRQLIPGIEQFSGKTLTMRVETGTVDSGLDYDWYVNARFNSTDGDNENQVDSGQSSLASDTVYTHTFTVEDLSLLSKTKNEVNSLSVAFRVHADAGESNASVEIKSFAIFEGSEDPGLPYSDVTYERPIYLQYHEVEDSFNVAGAGGLTASSGQKRGMYPIHRKRSGNAYTLTVEDAVGNSDKISTYSLAGSRTDNVAYSALQKQESNIVIVKNGTTESALGCKWEISV